MVCCRFTPALVVLAFLACTLASSISRSQTNQGSESPEFFSGPQVGEPMPGFPMKLIEDPSEVVDLIAQAEQRPSVMIFVHKRSRPAFGLANAIARYCTTKSKSPQSDQPQASKFEFGICFLTDDATDTQKWLGQVKRYFPEGTPLGFSPDGLDGPGAMGLNRNAELTVLVSDKKKVTANFALVQPGTFVDGPKILKAIADVIGDQDKIDINDYLPNNQAAQDAPIPIDPALKTAFEKIVAEDATEASIGESIVEIKALIEDNKPRQRQLGTLLAGLARNKKLAAIENEEQRETLVRWARQFSPRMNQNQRTQQDPKLTSMLRSLIQKTNSNEQVDSIAKEIEAYIEKNSAAKKEIARISSTIANSDKLSNYGTEHCQEQLKSWAKSLAAESDKMDKD